MSEIEKMYLLAGIRKGRMGDEDCAEDCLDYECKNCRYSNYPPFTAEKQIELIKWLAYKTHITIGKGLPWGQYDDNWWTVTNKKGSCGTNAYGFEEALANFVNCLWQDLTEEDKTSIKNILEM